MLCFNLCNHALGPVAYLELKSECIVRKYDLVLNPKGEVDLTSAEGA